MKLKIVMGLLLLGLVIAGSIQWESDLIFSHKQHAEDVGAECDACHAAAYTSVSGTDDLLPPMETCYDCHDTEMACTGCHQRDDDPILLPRITDYSPKFNHKVHVENGMNCLTCHEGIEQQVHVNEGIHIMDMDGCMTCHQTPAELAGCYLCHLETENLVPVNHAESWNQMHGMVSETGANNCQSCHLQSYCIDCHQGENLHNQTHPAEFLATHAISWQVREMECSSCHTRNYCIECHVEVNRVIPVNHLMAGWSGKEHAFEARRNAENCSVCHTQGDVVCGQCHF
jgi:hypothetical protein